MGVAADVTDALRQSESVRRRIAWRCAQELTAGVVNLGIGIPAYVADYLPPTGVTLHSENGVLGVGPAPDAAQIDPDLVNATKLPITVLPHASFFDSALSFAIMRGGHLDATVVGALQVAENGDLASWAIPGGDVLGVGGAMDLVVGARRVIAAMTHTTPQGSAKLVARCAYPLTAPQCVDTVVTEHAVFRIVKGRMTLVERQASTSLEALCEMTDATFDVHPQCAVAVFPF